MIDQLGVNPTVRLVSECLYLSFMAQPPLGPVLMNRGSGQHGREVAWKGHG